VADNGPGLAPGDRAAKPPGGVGLSNTRARLQQFYGDRQAFALAPNEPSGLVITMNIPFETDDDDPGTDR
jgi:LytS/YehU family sensor histidine kinase